MWTLFWGRILHNFEEVDTPICGFDFAQTDFRTPPQFWNPQIPNPVFFRVFSRCGKPVFAFSRFVYFAVCEKHEKRSKYLKTVQNVIFGWIWLDFG
jgi:hypothetical protein